MSVYAIPGKLYVGAITSTTGDDGTLIGNIDQKEIRIEITQENIVFRNGRFPDAYMTYFKSTSPLRLTVLVRDVSIDTISLLFPELTDESGNLFSSGMGVTNLKAKATAQSIIIRPNDNSQRYLYIKSASLAIEQITGIHYSNDKSVFEEVELSLISTRAAGDSEPSWIWGHSNVINTAYSGLS